jgi:hypothetical protein
MSVDGRETIVDPGEQLRWIGRLEAGDLLLRMLQRCRALAIDAGLPRVHGVLLDSLNLASMLHNAPDRLKMRDLLEVLAEDSENRPEEDRKPG